MSEKIIDIKIDKKQALLLVKKAVSSKFGILKDDGYTLKVGAPMMTATITITDKKIIVDGSGAGKIVAETCYLAIKTEIEMTETNTSSNNSQGNTVSESTISPLDEELKITQLLIQYKKMLDEDIIDEEFYNQKKESLLKMIKELDNVNESNNHNEGKISSNDNQIEKQITQETAIIRLDEKYDSDSILDLELLKKDISKLRDAEKNTCGRIYYNGLYGIKKDYLKAFEYFKSASDTNIDAKVNLAICYLYGNGIDSNRSEAIKLLRQAAFDGSERANVVLNRLYRVNN